MANINTRKLAYDILSEIIVEDAYSNIALNKSFSTYKLDVQDKKFISEIVYGTIKNKIYLEYVLKQHNKARIKPKVKILILMSMYQLIYMTKTPDFAITNEAVKIAKKIGGTFTAKFVNGFLRNFKENYNKDNIKFISEIEKIRIENSCPLELFNILLNQYGQEKTISIIKSFNKRSFNAIRYNPKKTTKKELMNYFTKQNKKIMESEICEDSLILDSLDLGDKYFKDGYYIVQDEASALVACAINEKLDEDYNIIDVCAAPGGKSLHIASKYFNCNLISCDKYIHKLNLIEDNVKKLGLTNIKTKEQDAIVTNENFLNNFDIVVCDVPCSGIGVIKNKPEIKYKITDDYIENIAKLQYDILEQSKNYVKDGGLLIYSTCTIDKRENEYNISKFLEENDDFTLEQISLKNSIVKEDNKGMLSILPDDYDCDGFYIAKLRKETK